VSALLAGFVAMHDARQQILDDLAEPIQLASDEDREKADLLFERQAAWSQALAEAKIAVGDHRLNVRKLRGYRRVLAGEH
jgi:hypothetical protein